MYKIGLIGLGNIARKHINAIDANKDMALCVGGYDTNPQNAAIFSEKYGVKIYDRPEDLIKNSDIVSVLTPHNTHAEITKKILKMNKLCICEKPLCLHFNELDKLTSAEKNMIFPISQNRYNDPIIKLYDEIKNNKLGKIRLIQANTLWYRNTDYYTKSPWRGKVSSEGGILYNQGIHIVDLILHLLDAKQKDCRILFATKNNVEKDIKETESSIKFVIKIKDTLVDVLISTIFAKENFENSLLIVGSESSRKISGTHLNLNYYPENSNEFDNKDIYGNSHCINYREILNYIASGTGNIVKYDEAMSCIKLIEKIYYKAKLID